MSYENSMKTMISLIKPGTTAKMKEMPFFFESAVDVNNGYRCHLVFEDYEKDYSFEILYEKELIDYDNGIFLEKIPPKVKLDEVHFVAYQDKVKKCEQCGETLVNREINYHSKSGRVKICYIKKCQQCGINYIHFNSYQSLSSNGKNPNVVLDKVIASPTVASASAPKPVVTVHGKTNKLEDVYVYKSINTTCKIKHKESVSRTPLTMKNAKNNEKITINAFYCQKCKKTFITYEAITKYTDAYYIPQVNWRIETFGGELKEISKLALYGYNVKANGLSERQRHAIIDFLIEYRIMTSMEIISFLEFQINLKKSIPSLQDACEKWYDDIQYIYKIKH